MGAQEGLLERVLAVLAIAHHVTAEGEQRRVMAVVDDREGAVVALVDEAGEPLVVELGKAGLGRNGHSHRQLPGENLVKVWGILAIWKPVDWPRVAIPSELPG